MKKSKLTQASVKKQLRAVGVSFRSKDGEFRVALGNEASAYYTNDLADALSTGLYMSQLSSVSLNSIVS